MRFDILFIKNKILARTLGEYKNTYRSLAESPDFMDEKTLHFLSNKIDKICRRDIKSINKAFRLINRQRNKWIKAGSIDTEDEMYEFMSQIGLYEPNAEETLTAVQKQIEKAGSGQEGGENAAAEQENIPQENAEETAKEEGKDEENPDAREPEGESAQTETGEQGEGTPLSASETKVDERTAKIKTEK